MKSAVVAVVGRTNAGKSTLVNRLVGEKVSIVSPVEQTTRNMVRGIVEDARGQLVLLDTPGLHKAVGELGRLLNRTARRSAAGADILCVLFDASVMPQLEDIGWMQRIVREHTGRVLFVLNKTDKEPTCASEFLAEFERVKAETPAQAEDADAQAGREDGSQTVRWVKAVSTVEGGEKEVLDALFEMADEGERLFPEDIVTDYPKRLAIADSIREKFLRHLHQEVPHELGIYVKELRETPERWDVAAEILVNRPSQKPIVIGRGAEIIKKARKAAERELKELFDVKVALELWVRVEPDWMKNKQLLARMGYL